MKYCFSLLLIALFAGCSDQSAGSSTNIDSVKPSIDSSAIMNDATKLPNDSTATGVTH